MIDLGNDPLYFLIKVAKFLRISLNFGVSWLGIAGMKKYSKITL